MVKKALTKIDLDYFEKVIIHQCLKNEHYLSSIIEYINPEYFKDVNIKNIIEIIVSFYSKRSIVPNFSEIKSYLVTDELKENFKRVVEYLKSSEIKINESELYDNTESFLKQKGIFFTMMKTTEFSEEKPIDSANLLHEFEQVCNISLDNEIGLNLFEDFDIVKQEILKKEQYISTGWKWLDKELGGGFHKNGKCLYVFAGETNIGKSIVLGNVANNIAKQGYSVLVITLEMSEQVYAKRLTANISQVSYNEMADNISEVSAKMEDFRLKNRDTKVIIKEFPPSVITPMELNGYIKKVSQKLKIDAIVLDYINLLTTKVGNNSYEKVIHISQQIRALSYTFACPIISATQFNRTAAGVSNPGMERVSESYGLCQTADVLIPIWRNDDADVEDDIIRFTIAKSRQGRVKSTQAFKVFYETMTILQDGDDNNETFGTDSVSDTIKGLSMFEETKDIIDLKEA